MNAYTPPILSLLERAARVYDFDSVLRPRDGAASLEPHGYDAPAPLTEEPAFEPAPAALHGAVDRTGLQDKGFVLPDAPAGTLAEELRIVKRGLLAGVRAKGAGTGQVVMICSARPDDGKTFTAVNLALSLAGERDFDMLLVDGDIAKPEIMSTLGLEGGAGLVHALADPNLDPESLVIRTDVGNLSVLPAGRQAHDATELLASGRMAEVLHRLTATNPRRVVLFDSPPALAASAASAIAGHVGQVVMVVRADQTCDADLREAVTLVGACGDIKLILNRVTYTSGTKRFSYYGTGR